MWTAVCLVHNGWNRLCCPSTLQQKACPLLATVLAGMLLWPAHLARCFQRRWMLCPFGEADGAGKCNSILALSEIDIKISGISSLAMGTAAVSSVSSCWKQSSACRPLPAVDSWREARRHSQSLLCQVQHVASSTLRQCAHYMLGTPHESCALLLCAVILQVSLQSSWRCCCKVSSQIFTGRFSRADCQNGKIWVEQVKGDGVSGCWKPHDMRHLVLPRQLGFVAI